MKLLLYCTKAKPGLMKYETIDGYYTDTDPVLDKRALLNGKIVAECDYEVEEICSEKLDNGVGYEPLFYTETTDNISKESCLTQYEIENYLGCKAGGEVVGYAIHIKNLNIFDKPRDLEEYEDEWEYPLEKAPQNMRRCYSTLYSNIEADMPIRTDSYILISIKPEWLCKILNGEKTIEVRKKVLREMLK